MTAHHIEPREIVDLVEDYVRRELADVEKYSNRTPLDDSGIYSLHRLAAAIYADGFQAGEQAAEIRAVQRLLRMKAVVPE